MMFEESYRDQRKREGTCIHDGKMIFVVGNSRSGTTMLGRILGRSKQVFMFNELHFFEQTWLPELPATEIDLSRALRYIARLMAVQRDGYYVKPDIEKYKQEASQLVELNPGLWTAPRAYAVFVLEESKRHGKSIPCDQTPRNLFYIHEILNYFPNAYFVHIVRDPRDVLLSQKNRWRRRQFSANKFPLRESIRSWANYHPVTISLLWRSGIKAWERSESHPHVIMVRFEDLLENPEGVVQRICSHIGIEYSPSMLEVPQIGSSHGKDQPDKLGINKEIAGRWQCADGLDMVDVAICQFILKQEMQKYRYPLKEIHPNILLILSTIMVWPLKAFSAFFANIRKSTNIWSYLLRRIGIA